MNTELINKVTAKIATKKVTAIKVGQTVQVDTLIRDGDKTRIQKFIGLVIAIKGSGTNKTFTVRKITNGYGVEKIFPFYSPTVDNIKILKEETVRKSKLYFMRERIGKQALKVRKGKTKIITQLPEENLEDSAIKTEQSNSLVETNGQATTLSEQSVVEVK